MDRLIIKYRWFIISFCIVLGVTFAILIPFSKTDPEIRNYIPLTMKSRIETDSIEKVFGVQDLVVVLFTDTNILVPEDLQQIKDIDRGISKITGITNRISPFTVQTIKSTEGMMTVNPLLRRIPTDSSDLKRLRSDILANHFAAGVVFSSDFTSASITATINKADPESVTLLKIDSVISSNPGKAGVLTGGLPYIRQHIMKDVRKDAVILVPFALLVMLLILKITLGEWKSVFMPFSVVLLSASISMGMIPLVGWKLSIISLLVPIILIAVANNYGIYLVSRSRDIIRNNPGISKEKMLSELMRSLNMPILFSGFTTIAGILGLLTHSIIPARQVGVLAATGVSAALLMSLTFIPALIYIRGTGNYDKNPDKKQGGLIERILKSITGLVIKYPGRIIMISAIFTIGISSGMFLLRIETNQENYFPKNNPLRKASEGINKKFGGSQTISVMISGDIKDPVIMNGIDKMGSALESIDGVGQVFSISQAVKEMSKAIYAPGDPDYDRIPATREGIAQMFELYNMSGNPDDFKQLMNLENSRAHILIKLSNPENRIINSVKSKIDEFRGKIPAKITVGGYAIIMADFAKSIIKGQVSSLLLAMITVIILLAIIFRSWQGGIVGSIPLAVSVVILFGFMGFAKIALDAATALLSSIMIGVGVDFTIQFLWSFNGRIRQGFSAEDSIKGSMQTIGRSIIINALSVMSGFSVLIFSGFTSIRFFGYLVVISIGSCLLGAIVLIPAIIMKFKPAFLAKELNKLKYRNYEKDNELHNIRHVAYTRVSTAPGCRRNYEQKP